MREKDGHDEREAETGNAAHHAGRKNGRGYTYPFQYAQFQHGGS